MKILRYGNLGNLKRWNTVVVCEQKEGDHVSERGCNAKFQATLQDLAIQIWLTDEEQQRTDPYVQCPQCGKSNMIPWIPETLWEKLKKRLDFHNE